MPRKILIVDDSPTVLLMEKMVLAKLGCELHTAKDGQEALEKAQAERPDLVLMDVVMPRMNGFEACRKLRESEATCDTPVILITTRGEFINAQTGYEAGCNDYLTKPINGAELLAKVKGVLGI